MERKMTRARPWCDRHGRRLVWRESSFGWIQSIDQHLIQAKVGSDGKATRKARVLAKGVKHKFGVFDNYFWLLERSTGFERGGRLLTIYQLAG